MNTQTAQDLRKLMIERIEKIDPDKKASLALSGGVDCVTVLFAMLESGRKPRCYTFYAEGYESNDLKSSRALCKFFDLEHITVPVPVGHDQIVEDVKKLIPHNHAPRIKKTIIQCLHPWLYVCPEMVRNKDELILIGFAADNYYTTGRKSSEKRREIGEDAFRSGGFRDHKFHDLRYVDANVAKFCKDKHSIVMEDVYATEPIQEWFKEFDIPELHKDQNGKTLEKAASVYAFSDYYSKGPFYRKHASYQVDSGIREFHDSLVFSEKYNPGGRFKSVIGIYNMINRGEV